MKGILTLIPTPIDNTSALCPIAKMTLQAAHDEKDIILVEEVKEGRRRWLRFGLPREAIENFILYNEHTRSDLAPELIKELKQGKNIFIMSDCGLPAFCDPGMELVNLCHHAGIRVTSTPFANSIVLALALSGFAHNRFVFEGFIPAKKDQRIIELRRILKQKETSILMDTPYRLASLLEQIELLETKNNIPRELCLALDLNQETEQILRGTITEIKKQITNFKREFILVINEIARK